MNKLLFVEDDIGTVIDQTQENSSSCYVIDFLPKTMTDRRYFESEQFFSENYLEEFAQKLIRVNCKRNANSNGIKNLCHQHQSQQNPGS